MKIPTSRAIIGIDPGKNGGIAICKGRTIEAFKIPETQGDLLELLRAQLVGIDEATVYLEKVGGYVAGNKSPGSAMFSFGEQFGFIKGICMAYRLPLVMVTPQAWLKSLGMGTKGDLTPTAWKNKLKSEAQRLYPQLKITLATSDALLILEHARRCEK